MQKNMEKSFCLMGRRTHAGIRIRYKLDFLNRSNVSRACHSGSRRSLRRPRARNYYSKFSFKAVFVAKSAILR